MTNQEAFNKIWQHFIVEKQPLSSDPVTGACFYRHPETGAKCAVGSLIPDDQCPPNIDTVCNITKLVRVVPALQGLDVVFLSYAQAAHDRAAKRTRVEQASVLADNLRGVAAEYGLTVPEGAVA